MSNNVETVFNTLKETFEKNDEVRDKIRQVRDNFDMSYRSVKRAIAELHTAPDLKEACVSIREELSKAGAPLAAIEKAIPEVDDETHTVSNSYYRYSELWQNQRQSVCAAAVMLEFLDADRLPDVEAVVKLLGTDVRLTLDDFLVGVCDAVSDMVRLCTNRVIRNDFETPARCVVFASQIFDAFKELNFRNDFLRKRFDGLKYDVKRLEEIVYDLSIRGLLPKSKPSDGTKPQANDMDTA